MTNIKHTDLIAIIDACGRNNVLSFEGRGIKLQFEAKVPVNLTMGQNTPNNDEGSIPFTTTDLVEISEDEQLSRAMLSDPEAYEDMV